jgi:hypothetical protein
MGMGRKEKTSLSGHAAGSTGCGCQRLGHALCAAGGWAGCFSMQLPGSGWLPITPCWLHALKIHKGCFAALAMLHGRR